MEPDQQLTAEKDDQEKLQTVDEHKKENEENEADIVVKSAALPDAKSIPESAKEKSVELQKSPEVQVKEVEEKAMPKESETPESVENENSKAESDNKENSHAKEPENVKKVEDTSGDKPHLPSFPGTVTKSVPGSNDVKIEIDSNSLLDRVILYSLKNTVVDNSRLDAAKNKYMLNNGNITSGFNSNSNGSDSNSSSKSVDKLIEEFKGGCSKEKSESPPVEATTVDKKSDIIESSNGADNCVNASNSNSSEEAIVRENYQNVISSSPGAELNEISESQEMTSHNQGLENEALDFRDRNSSDYNDKESSPTMLDLSVPHRDQKSVPPIKRNHALYVGLPDFSKQIFTAPSISRPTNTMTNQVAKPSSTVGPPRVKNPDFSATSRDARGAPDLQMRHPDFSKGFAKAETPPTVPVTPSNFPEIVRKNNYISDLQLKLPSTAANSHSPAPSASYKIDFRSSAAISQKIMQEPKDEQPSTSQTVYPNLKKEGINAYNQQLIIDEPMAHIIHKNQFMPHTNEQARVGSWSERGERLLGGSALVSQPTAEAENRSQIPPTHQFLNTSEDLRKNHPAYYPHPYKEREFNNNAQEIQQMSQHEFSLKQKEQQLRQEGTIITVKNEPIKTPTTEITERRSADLFRDYKLKQPKESPDSARRAVEQPPVGYQQAYPDFPVSFPKYNHQPKVESIVKQNHSPAPPLAYTQKPVASSSRNYHSPSPVSYHHQPKSPLTVPPGPSMMNPPQNWPPPLVQQPMPRHIASSATGSPNMSQSPTSYQHPSQSQSPHMNYGYPYAIPTPTGPQAVKVNHQNYQQYPPSRGDIKEIPNRHYQPPTSTSSSAAQNYYHQKYPDFACHFDGDKKPPTHDPNAKYPSNFMLVDHRHQTEANYQRFAPHHELEIRTVREQQQYRPEVGPSYYPRDAGPQNYPPRGQEPLMRHHEIPPRSDDAYERSRGIPQLKVERRMDEPPKIMAGPSNLPLRRPEPTEVSVIAKVKIEPAPLPPRNIPSTSTIIKSAKSIFAEVKRESPLDLSVKTVKTKADSTGCDQDISSRHRPEPSGLKVEFMPNFSKVAKSECRQQARMGPHEYPPARPLQNVPERSSGSQKYPSDLEKVRTPPSSAVPTQVLQQQVPRASSSRNYYPDHRFQPVKDAERPAPSLPNSSQYPDRSGYQPDVKPSMDSQRPGPSNMSQAYPHKEIPRPEDKHRVDSRRVNSYYLPPHQAAPPAVQTPYASNKPNHHATADTSRPSHHIPPHASSSRDPLHYERERDRKYVEEILNRRKEPVPLHPDMRQFQPIASPPRKRIIEQHQNNAVPPKQGRLEDSSRFVQDPRQSGAMMQHRAPPQNYPQFEPQRFQKFDAYAKPMPAIGQPPALVKNEAYQKPPEAKFYPPDSRRDAVIMPVMPTHPAQYPNNYYPNPKAEMIQRSDPSNSYKQERTQFPNQNFQQRPDDNTLQLYPRIHHPIQQESGIKNEHQLAGPLPGTSGESARLLNGMIPTNISGSNGNIARGADQSTILKLKTNLELKEQKKLIIHKSEIGDDFDLQKKDLSPRQFRTKGELKGFIPVPSNADAKSAPASSPALPAGPSAFDLLDWGSACNDFVQQLETGKKKAKKKRSINPPKGADEKPVAEIPGTTGNNLSDIPKEIMKGIEKAQKNSSSDEDKPLLELVNPQNNGADVKLAHDSVVEKISEKISRNIREKQRLELEQKLAARLGKPSSSESESESRRPARTTKRVRRLRKRAALGIKKTDEELSVEEEETEEELARKRRNSKSVSKLEDLTSSDDDKKKVHGKERRISERSSKAAKKPKDGEKKLESSTESSESEVPTVNKITKLSTAKNAKKLKELGNSPSIKNMLEEEETMTRSKRKLEIEKKLSNSKILRNEKVVQNKAPDKKAKIEVSPTGGKKTSPKRKDSTKSDDVKRKLVESDSDTNTGKSKKKSRRVSKLESSSSSEESPAEEDNKAERLRPRKTKQETESPPKAPKEAAKKKADEKTPSKTAEENAPESDTKQSLPCRIPISGVFPFKDETTTKFTPGWEAETYNFKRSLKIPAGLITIGRPPQHGISHSLPDLDPQTSDTSEIFSEFVKSKDLKNGSKDSECKAESSKANKQVPKPSSIIDLLHQRVVQSRKKFKTKKASNAVGAAAQGNDDDLLPTPEKESEKVFGFKKNIFETSIITSRTRTENNALRKKEILKEVFGADEERPKSAPPPLAGELEAEAVKKEAPEAVNKISYDQKYREYLEKMNVDFFSKPSDSKIEDCKTADTSVKDEDDDDDDNETVVASERDLVTPTLKGKVKKARGRRCKGSSGFDYIRKKKKPTANASENPMSVNNIIKKRMAAMENLENKDETDISKEIKGWVLNKGVGESVLHKASRLDYVDVIAYCLDRLNMNPDPKDNAGYTPLHEACSRGHLEIARILLQYGANHSETALSGIRPLHEAIENGHVEIVRLLISYGADPCLATYSGQLPISMAEDKDMEDFLNDYLIDIEDKKGRMRTWHFDGPYKVEDPSEQGYEVFNDIPINKADLGSSIASVFSTSLTSLVTATTQMSDNETIASETTATPIKVPATPMKAPSQDLIKYQHKMKKCDTNSNNLVMTDVTSQDKVSPVKKKTKGCSVVLNQIDSTMKKIKKLPAIAKQEQITPQKLPEPIQKLEEIKHKEDYDDMMVDGDNMESDSEFLELEESEAPLPPLYLLKDEGSDKWILLTDLCNLLKVKSKDAVLKQICPSSPPSVNKELIRELKMSDFLEKAICLQLFCAGEKLNVRASKVSLVRYNESVKNLLGVQTIRMNM